MDKEITCCFTGHRPSKLPWGQNENDLRCIAVKQELASRLEGIYETGFRHFMCGMAIGCDMYFAEAVLTRLHDAQEQIHGGQLLAAAGLFHGHTGRHDEHHRLCRAQRAEGRADRNINHCQKLLNMVVLYRLSSV